MTRSQLEILQDKVNWLEDRLDKIEKTYLSRYWNDGSGPSGTLFEFDRRLGKLEQAHHEPPFPYLPKAFVSVAPKADLEPAIRALGIVAFEKHKTSFFGNEEDFICDEYLRQSAKAAIQAIQVLQDYQRGNNGGNK